MNKEKRRDISADILKWNAAVVPSHTGFRRDKLRMGPFHHWKLVKPETGDDHQYSCLVRRRRRRQLKRAK